MRGGAAEIRARPLACSKAANEQVRGGKESTCEPHRAGDRGERGQKREQERERPDERQRQDHTRNREKSDRRACDKDEPDPWHVLGEPLDERRECAGGGLITAIELMTATVALCTQAHIRTSAQLTA